MQAMHEVAVMQDKAGVEQKVSRAELIALFCQTQEEIEAHGESNELNLLLGDFAKELLKQRLFARVESVLASSLDATVVTSVGRRFVAANPKTSSLFGISETNMKMFTIDAFLSRGRIPFFDENGAPFISRKEKHGQCKIRLDGSARVAKCLFVAKYLPLQHLCKFRNDRKRALRKRLAA